MLASVASVATFTTTAAADTAVVFPHSGDSRLVKERDAAYRAVLTELRAQGFKVRIQTTKPARNATDLSSDCAQVNCAPAMLTAAKADIAVAVAVWQAEDSAQVNITLVDKGGARYPSYASVTMKDVASATRGALVEARSLQLLGPGPWIQVQGEPSGAALSIDGKAVGVVPYRGAISPGVHSLQLEASGFTSKQNDINIPLEPTLISGVTLALDVATTSARDPIATAQPTGSTAAAPAQSDDRALTAAIEHDTRETRDEASIWNFVIAGVVGVSGLALATIEPIQTASRSGECANTACTEVYKVGAATGFKIMLGAVMVGAGVTLAIWQPIRVQAEVGPDQAALKLGAHF